MIQCDNPIVISPLLTALFSKEWIELNCIEYFSSGNLPHRFSSLHWDYYFPNTELKQSMFVMALTFATELVEADKVRLHKHYEQNSNCDVRVKVIYTNWDTLDVLIGQNTRGSNVTSDRQKKINIPYSNSFWVVNKLLIYLPDSRNVKWRQFIIKTEPPVILISKPSTNI